MLTPRWPLLPGPDAARLVEFDTGDGKLTRVAIDPAGAWAATGATGGAVRLWNPRTGEQLMRLDTGADVEALAAAPDGSLVAAVNRDGVHVWEVPSGRLLHRLAPSKHLTGCAISAGNRWLVAWDTAAVRRWDLTAPRPTRSLRTLPTVEERPLPRQAVTAVSAGGTLVAAHDGRQLIHVWEIGTLELVATLDLGAPAAMMGLTFASGDRSLIVAQAGKVRILRVADGTEEHEVSFVHVPVPFAGDLLLDHIGAGFTLHNRRGLPVLSVPGGRSGIAGIAATPDDRLLVCAHEGGSAVVWDGDALRRLVEDDRSGRVYQCLPVPGADWFLTTHLNRTVVRSMADASTLHTLSEEYLHSADVAPDNSWVAVASHRELTVFDTGTWQALATAPGKFGTLCHITPDGQTVIGIGSNALTTWTRPGPDVHGMALADTASRSGKLHIWRTAAFRPKPASVRIHDGSFRMVIDPAGRWVATFGDDRRLCFLPTRNLQYGYDPDVVTETDHDIRAAAASPDGTRIATADTGGTLRVLTAPAARGETPVLLAKLTVQARPDALTWTADGIFTAGPYGTELFEVSP
jgi:WD40 repeat protein